MKRIALAACAMMFAAPASATELGIYEGPGCQGVANLANFDKWLGGSPTRVLDYASANSWTDMVQETNWAVQCWSKAKLGVNLTYSVPMLVYDKSATLKNLAAGSYDSYFTQIGQALVAKGYANAIIRLGWEFNGSWFPWGAKPDPTNWVAGFRHVVTVMRAVKGQNFKFDWSPTLGQGTIKPDSVYPGDDVVDYIGADTYNQDWSGTGNTMPTSATQRWTDYLTEAYGLNWLASFSIKHKKPISLPEWGTCTRADGHGGADDAYFVNQMAAWMSTNKAGYQQYFDFNQTAMKCKLSAGQFPTAGAAFKADFKSAH